MPLLSALAYLHGKGIAHRDVKLENVLLGSDGRIQLADLGFAVHTLRARMKTQVRARPSVSTPRDSRSIRHISTLYLSPDALRISGPDSFPGRAPTASQLRLPSPSPDSAPGFRRLQTNQDSSHNFRLPIPAVPLATQVGTLSAMAPEVLLADPTNPSGPLRSEVSREARTAYDAKVDVWALGVLTWELLCGTRER